MNNIIQELKLGISPVARLIKRLKAAVRPREFYSHRILAPGGMDLSFRREAKSLLYRLLAGNLVGYFLSVTIVSIFLGLGLLIKNYKLINGFGLLKSATFSYERILPLFSQVIFGLLAISLLLIGSLCVYSIIQRYLFSPGTRVGSKLFRISIILMSGYSLLEVGRIYRGLWNKPLLYVSLCLSELLTLTYEKLSGISYDTSLALLLLIISVFFFIVRIFFSLPLVRQGRKADPSVTGLTPMLISVIQVITIVGIILMVNIFVLGIILALTIKKTLLLYYVILMVGLGITYLTQELFVLKNWQRPVSLGLKLALGGMYIFTCLALESTSIKLLQLFQFRV
jgi:hypothetical protein